MIILDTTLHCHDCGSPLPYNLHVLIDITLDSREEDIDHVCILCNNCSETEEMNYDNAR